MSSRKLLMYMDGMLSDSHVSGGWYARAVLQDLQEMQADEAAAEERLRRAENTAHVTGAPLDMADIQAPE